MAEKLSFSFSKMGMYKECPLKYKFRYVENIPEKPKSFFAFGTALHSVMEYLYSSLKPEFPPLNDVLAFFKKDWESKTYLEKGYASKLKEQEAYLEGVRIINAYYAKYCSAVVPPLATELMVKKEIDGLFVVGIVDRLDYLGGGKVSILDYKTGKKIERSPDQLMMYQMLIGNNPSLEKIVKAKYSDCGALQFGNMAFLHLPSLESQTFEPAAEEELKEFWARVLAVAADIKAEKFNPSPSERACRFCDYRDRCPVWKLSPAEEAEISAENAAPLPSADPLAELSEKVDAYGKALQNVKDLEKEIISFMKERNLNRHFGAEFEVSLEKLKKINFNDKGKTLETLKSLNLLSKTLVPTLGSIKALLESGSLTPEQKKILSDLAVYTEEYKINCSKTND